MNLHRINLFSLTLFAQIARSGSTSGGASLANLAVSAAPSQRINDLKAVVGEPMLERHPYSITLTIAGKAIELHAQRIR